MHEIKIKSHIQNYEKHLPCEWLLQLDNTMP